jgi:hypothetical protein
VGPKRTPRPDRADGNGSAGTGDGHPPTDVDAGPSSADELVLGVAAGGRAPSADATTVPPAPDGLRWSAVERTTSVPEVAAVAAAAGGGDDPGRRRSRAAPDPDVVKVGRRQGRRVRRTVRRIDLWSVLKLAIVLYTCLYAAVMATLALVWGLAYSSGQIEKVQSFMSDVGLDNYRFYGDQMWRACAMIGAVGVLAATVITVLTAALVNVISETTGGIRFVVIEEDPRPRRRPSAR